MEKKQMSAVVGAARTVASSLRKLLISSFSALIFANVALMFLSTGGQLLLRVYFLHGGRLLWLTTAVQLCGFPILLLPISLSSSSAGDRLLSLPFLASVAAIGTIFAACSYLFAVGSSFLPLSTSSLLWSTQLAFNAFFALLLVRQRFSPYSLNAVVLLTMGPIVLALGAGGDAPTGVTRGQYTLGFGMMVAAAALNGFALPLIEWVMARWIRTAGATSFRAAMEMLFVLEFAGTVVSFAGMVISGDFQAMGEEAKGYELGVTKYYLILFWDAIFWQIYNVGILGLISCASSLLAGVVVALLLPFTEILAVVFLHERFDGTKGVALALSLWGFASYLFGEHRLNRHANKLPTDDAAAGEIAVV